MEKLLLTTQNDTSKLMAMMYLDIGNYSFEKINEGILIDFDEENPKSLRAFSRRFATWFTNEAFIVNGNQYFEDHPQVERWNIWKHDFRFLEAYRDDFYQILLAKRIEELFVGLEEYVALQISLEDLINQAYELTEMRMQLVEEHFENNVHENYILLRLQLNKQKEALPSK